MAYSNDLFLLIKSMSRSEKGYFKKFAQKHTIGRKNIYIKLFDAIDRQELYDEKELKKKFIGEKFIENIYSTKNYLFNLILKALSSYHSEKFVISRLNTMLIELNVLFEKGLYKQYKNLLKKSVELAHKHDKRHYLTLLYDKEIKFVVTEYYEGSSSETFHELRKKVLSNIDHLKLDITYELLYYELFHLLKKMGSVRTANDINNLNKFMSNPLLQDKNKAVNFNSKYHLYSILGHYYRAINDFNNWYKYRRTLLDLVESDIKYIKEYPTSYIAVQNNYLNACVHIGRYKEFESNLEKLRKFSKQFENKKEYIDTQIRLFLLISDLELSYILKSFRFDKIKALIEKIEFGFKKFGAKINENRKTALYNRISYASFINKDFDKSIYYLNKILNITDPKIEPEQHSFARIRSLIVHYEAGNYELLEYTLRSTKRFLLKTNRMYKFEKAVLDFITKAMKCDNETDLISIYHLLKNELNKIAVDKFEKNALEQFDVISWLESKINKKIFAETLKERTRKQKAKEFI